jgi:hypothetical protein
MASPISHGRGPRLRATAADVFAWVWGPNPTFRPYDYSIQVIFSGVDVL